jgi:hypothetical protein
VVVPCSLTCNPTRTLPNQVSCLKGSSMESFTLGPTPKIDFRCSATTTHLQWLQRKNNVSEHLWNSIPNSCSSQCPGPSIYRLRCRMGDCCNMYGRRPNGGPRPSGRTTVRQDFLRILLKSFLFKSRVRTIRHSLPDGRTSSAIRFHIRLRASGPWGMSIRTAEL